MPWVWFGKWDDGHEKDTPIRTGALFIVLCLFYVFMCVFLVFIVLFFFNCACEAGRHEKTQFNSLV